MTAEMPDDFRATGAHRLRGLTGLRAFAAITVVLHHFGADVVPSWLQDYLRAGGYWVDVFFVLSGFLLGYAYTEASGRLNVSRRQFLTSRLVRIYPAYLLALVLNLPGFLDLLPGGSGPTRSAKIAIIVVSTLTLTQAWLPKGQSWNDPAWSLSGEAFFYLAMALLGAWALRNRSLRARVCAALAACVVSAVVLSAVTHDHATLFLYLSRLPLLRVAPFLLAALVGNRVRHDPGRVLDGLSKVQWPLFLALVGAIALLPPAREGLGHLTVSLIALALIVAMTGIGQAGSLVRLADLRPVRVLGEASYGVYIYQAGLHDLLVRAGLPRKGSVSGVLVFLAVLVAFSVASFYWYERPLQRAWRRRSLANDAATDSAAA
jgi:peptidoglycan/LPS O-acetylase OafA/YrhL